MKSIKDKEKLIQMSMALGVEPDQKILKEVLEYRALMKNIKAVGEEFNTFINEVKNLTIEEPIEVKPVDFPKPPSVDELLLEIKNEVPLEIPKPPTLEELLEFVGEQKEEKEEKEEPKNKLVDLSANLITKEVKLEEKSPFAQPEVPLARSLEDLKKKVKFLEEWISKLSLAGPGSGEVRLLNLDDVDTTGLGDQKFIKYNATSGKLEFATVSGGGGGSVSEVNGQTGNVVLTTDDISESTNLYFTNSRAINAFTAGSNISISANGVISANVVAGSGSVDLTSVSSNIIPSANSTFDLGAPNLRWKTLYLANNTIDLGGALIRSDGTGALTISSSGAILPVNSKISVGDRQQEIALVSNTGSVSKVVPFYTQTTGLNTVAANFEFGVNPDDYVFTNFTLNNGATLQQARVAQFYF